jgi:hypothetical protein
MVERRKGAEWQGVVTVALVTFAAHDQGQRLVVAHRNDRCVETYLHSSGRTRLNLDDVGRGCRTGSALNMSFRGHLLSPVRLDLEADYGFF